MKRCTLLFIGAAAALGQAPNLSMRYSQDAQGKIVVELENRHSQPATAYAVSLRRGEPGGSSVTWSYMTTDSVLGTGQGKLLEPGQKIQVTLDPNGSLEGARIEVAAVIYSDGSAAGQPESIESLRETRTKAREDIPYVTKLLEEAIARGDDRDTLLRKVHEMRDLRVRNTPWPGEDPLARLWRNQARPFLTLVPDRVLNWLREPGADPNDVVRKLREWGARVQ